MTIDDIAAVTDKFYFTLYADDTTLLEPLCTFSFNFPPNYTALSCLSTWCINHVLSCSINRELLAITDWLCLNKLSLNVGKTKMMIFHYRQRNISHIKPHLLINGKHIIKQVSEFNFLGIIIDESLTWNDHVQKISSKIAVTVGTMNRLKRVVPKSILKTIYSALIQPFLNYGILLWGHNTSRVFKLQKRAVRAITCS